MNLENTKLAILGLGYVGLPLAVEFARQRPVIAFDINQKRIADLQAGRDYTRETTPEDLAQATGLTFTANPNDLADCNVYIVTVPTPIDASKAPDLRPLTGACETIGKQLRAGDTVIFESTVYPGCTEEHCVPLLQTPSGLKYSSALAPAGEQGRGEGGFFCGYSPERMNPGDKDHTVTRITKVTSGSTPETADFVDALYASIVTAGTHKAPSIKVAEAAKVIENIQRDVNVALVNELAMLFHRLDINTLDVLQAAGTKWNFLPFRPGLVGGHCIGMDPYYLTHKAQSVGHHAEMILAGRRINDAMGAHIADRTVKAMLKAGFPVAGSRILIMGLAFKENTPDLRNTRVVDIINQLAEYNAQVDVWDPWVDPEQAQTEYGISLLPAKPGPATYQAVILAVAHREFLQLGQQAITELGVPGAVIFDVKGALPHGAAQQRL
ncbi:MAG: nucleotide sugar dehydrogenase [Salinisphaera sp.]|nr:nucleotide sugar dehydrogenase [Salinisphaera sp.]